MFLWRKEEDQLSELMELNAYRIMWLFVFFDLPTETKRDRKNAQQFRKNLIKDGFTMMQFSVYTRHCASSESANAHEKRVNNLLPPLGKVSLLRITDKQYGDIANFWGQAMLEGPPKPKQLELF
jgi:CRISPR-associated protein Cas2